MISKVALAVYVDDLFIAGRNEEDIFYVKQLLKQKCELKNLGKIWIIFNMNVKRFGQYITVKDSALR